MGEIMNSTKEARHAAPVTIYLELETSHAQLTNPAIYVTKRCQSN